MVSEVKITESKPNTLGIDHAYGYMAVMTLIRSIVLKNVKNPKLIIDYDSSGPQSLPKNPSERFLMV